MRAILALAAALALCPGTAGAETIRCTTINHTTHCYAEGSSSGTHFYPNGVIQRDPPTNWEVPRGGMVRRTVPCKPYLALDGTFGGRWIMGGLLGQDILYMHRAFPPSET